MSGAKATAPPPDPRMCLSSLCQHPRLGAWGHWHCTPKPAPPGPWGCRAHPPSLRSPQPSVHLQGCSWMHKGHWRGQGIPAVLTVPADGASLVGRAQAGRGPQLLPKNLLVSAGWAHVSCSCLPPPLLPPSCPGEGLALLGHPRMQPGCSLLSGLPFPGRDEGVTQGVSCHPGKVGGSSHGRPHKPPALQWAPSSPAQL